MKAIMESIKKMSTSAIKTKLQSGKFSDEQKQCAIEVLKLRGFEWKEEKKEESVNVVNLICQIIEMNDTGLCQSLTEILGDKEYADDYSDLEPEKVEKIKALLFEKPKKETEEPKTEEPKMKKSETPKEKITKDRPKEGSKSAKIYEALTTNKSKSMYALSKELGCHYSEVVRVKKLYNL